MVHLYTCYHTFKYYFIYMCNPGMAPLHLYSNGGPFKYFTYWILFAHTLTFGLILVTDYIDNSSVVAIRDLLFNSVALPFGLFVTTFYWFVYAIDSDLIRPEGAKKYEPLWRAQVIHTLAIITTVLEVCLVDHKNGQNDKEELVMFTFLLLYNIYFLYVGYFRKDWVYPFMNHMNWVIKLLVVSAFLVAGKIYYSLGHVIYKLAWR